MRGPSPRMTLGAMSLAELARAAGVLAVLPDQPFAVLDDVFGDQRHRILTMIVERDRPDDGVVIDDIAERGGELLAVGADCLDLVEDELHGHEGKRAVRIRRLLVVR